MRYFRLLSILSLCLVAFSAPVEAKRLSWSMFSLFSKPVNATPHIGQQDIRQRSLWDGDTWAPSDWIQSEDDPTTILRGFYDADIITDQYQNRRKMHVLEVGDAFIDLSGKDQRRVLAFVDYVFGITEAKENGTFFVMLKRDKSEPLGLYNKYGFQSY